MSVIAGVQVKLRNFSVRADSLKSVFSLVEDDRIT
jgi:hypothetical protein